MEDIIIKKMDEWSKQNDDVSMFKFASMLFITAPENHDEEIKSILNTAEYLASNLNDIELARAKKEIQQLTRTQ
jgi:hypothetical protein